ncbi:MAG: acyl carrier protein [Oscillospiraceae bacterium]|nr:acyl carrier protein [Oscillospiraceae bacterium]
MTVFETIRRILADQLELDPEQITEETDIARDLGADSLDVVEMITTIEDEYGIIITDESVNEFTTVGDVTRFIEKLVG